MAKLKFFEVELSLIGKKVPILGKNLEDLKDRRIIFDMTRELNGKMAEAKFAVKIKDNKAYGDIVYFGLIQNYARRLVRKGTSPVEDSFVAVSKDGFKLRIKPLLVTRKKVPRSIRRSLRKKARELITNFVEKNEKDKIFHSIINYIMQRQIMIELKKIYPLLICEIRRIGVEK